MKIITLCGSTKFKEAFQFFNSYLTMHGNLVFSVAMWSHDKHGELTPIAKKHLDRIHFAKILASDEIYVLDVGGYIGESTEAEIEWAYMNNKVVRYLSNEFKEWEQNKDNLAKIFKSVRR